MTHSKGFRRKTRSLMKGSKRAKGLSQILTEYHINDKVVITIDPSQVKGMPHRRFQGKVGTVEEVGSRSLLINVPIGKKMKRVTARLEHVKQLITTPQQ
jgi:large subunit ribosomal protein L21e